MTTHIWSAPAWFPLGTYEKGDIVRYGEALYECIEAHDGESAWTPPEHPNLWKRIRRHENGLQGEGDCPGSQ